MAKQANFVYVSAVKGRAVVRFPTLIRGGGPLQYIGAKQKPPPKDPKNFAEVKAARGLVFNTEAVIAIPLAEWTRFRRQYRTHVRLGDLIERTKADHDAWVKKQQVASKQAEADAKKGKAEAKKPGAEAPVEGD